MEAPFVPVTDAAALERRFADSHAAPVLLFLHDPHCGTSARAYRELAALPGPVPLLDVAAARQLSRLVEERTGVKHESPQALVLRDGRATWSASHCGVTAEAVTRALGVTPPDPRPGPIPVPDPTPMPEPRPDPMPMPPAPSPVPMPDPPVQPDRPVP